MKLSKKLLYRFSFLKRYRERQLLIKVGAVVLDEFNSNRNIRRKIKGTLLERKLIYILNNANK